MEERNQAVEQFFTKEAPNYSNLFSRRKTGANHGFIERLRIASELCEGTSGALLDCACGSGEITSSIVETGRYSSATLVDISDTMLSMARQRIDTVPSESITPEINFINSDVFNYLLSGQERPFDLILCLGLIAHTGRLEELLSALKKVLSENGRILVQTTLLNHLFTRLIRAASEKRYERNHGYSISYYTERDLAQACEAAGLTIDTQVKFFLGLPFGDQVFPRANYFLEVACKKWANRHGTEALLMLKKR
jgi:ubiquinone/menaquinone biosynthesis C-methylase UbiE